MGCVSVRVVRETAGVAPPVSRVRAIFSASLSLPLRHAAHWPGPVSSSTYHEPQLHPRVLLRAKCHENDATKNTCSQAVRYVVLGTLA